MSHNVLRPVLVLTDGKHRDSPLTLHLLSALLSQAGSNGLRQSGQRTPGHTAPGPAATDEASERSGQAQGCALGAAGPRRLRSAASSAAASPCMPPVRSSCQRESVSSTTADLVAEGQWMLPCDASPGFLWSNLSSTPPEDCFRLVGCQLYSPQRSSSGPASSPWCRSSLQPAPVQQRRGESCLRHMITLRESSQARLGVAHLAFDGPCG